MTLWTLGPYYPTLNAPDWLTNGIYASICIWCSDLDWTILHRRSVISLWYLYKCHFTMIPMQRSVTLLLQIYNWQLVYVDTCMNVSYSVLFYYETSTNDSYFNETCMQMSGILLRLCKGYLFTLLYFIKTPI